MLLAAIQDFNKFLQIGDDTPFPLLPENYVILQQQTLVIPVFSLPYHRCEKHPTNGAEMPATQNDITQWDTSFDGTRACQRMSFDSHRIPLLPQKAHKPHHQRPALQHELKSSLTGGEISVLPCKRLIKTTLADAPPEQKAGRAAKSKQNRGNLELLNVADGFLQEGAGNAGWPRGWCQGDRGTQRPAAEHQAEQRQHCGEAPCSPSWLGPAGSWLPFIHAPCEEMINSSPQICSN